MCPSVLRWDAATPVRRAEPTVNPEAPRRGDASDVEIVLPGRGLQYPGRLTELTAQGCLVQTKCRMEDGSSVEVWLRTEGLPLRLAARLVQKSERGVQFDFQPMPPRKQDQLEALRLELGMR